LELRPQTFETASKTAPDRLEWCGHTLRDLAERQALDKAQEDGLPIRFREVEDASSDALLELSLRHQIGGRRDVPPRRRSILYRTSLQITMLTARRRSPKHCSEPAARRRDVVRRGFENGQPCFLFEIVDVLVTKDQDPSDVAYPLPLAEKSLDREVAVGGAHRDPNTVMNGTRSRNGCGKTVAEACFYPGAPSEAGKRQRRATERPRL
jgi:hypothetical protein